MPGSEASGDLEPHFNRSLSGCVAVDFSANGRIEISGADRLDLVHRLSTTDLRGASPGDLRPTLFLTEKGRIVDRVLLFVMDSAFVMLTSPGAQDNVLRWIQKFTITEDVVERDITSNTSICCLIGAKVESALLSTFGYAGKPNSWQRLTLEGCELTIGLHKNSRESIAYVMTDPGHAPKVWNKLEAEGISVRPVASEAYEAHRINRGIPSWGRELSDQYTPLDVGLREEVSFTKGCYIGQEVIARLDTYKKAHRSLTGIVFREMDPEGAGQALLFKGKEIGVMTSVTPRPVQGQYLGLGVVEAAYAASGNSVVTTVTGAKGSLVGIPIIPESQ